MFKEYRNSLLQTNDNLLPIYYHLADENVLHHYHEEYTPPQVRNEINMSVTNSDSCRPVLKEITPTLWIVRKTF